jgi:ribosomal protein S18 acetylase RimI-like enzyme
VSATGVALRPIRLDDEPFLRRVYASTRLEELAPLGWSAAQLELFLRQQFDAQHRHYQTHYPDAAFSVVLLDQQPIGRLYVARCPERILLLDVALLPAHRNAGVGTRLLRALLDEAEQAGKPVRLHVDKLNRALRLYERHGFSVVGDEGVYWCLEWAPARVGSAQPAA